MKTENLILTSTKDMSRKQWLDFRNPMTHVMELLKKFNEGLDSHTLLVPNEMYYNGLKQFFSLEIWKDFIFPCLGASEAAGVMGLNPYKSIIELYYEKIGVKIVNDFDNAAMFWGRELEEQVAEKWQYWSGDAESMIENFTNKNLIRKCRRLNAYTQNKKFAWLFVSLDRVINKTEFIDEGALECKTISGFAADKWESGIPPMYIVQLQTQVAVLEFMFGEIAILKDGRFMDVLPFERHDDVVEGILSRSKDFFDRVKNGIMHHILSLVAPTEELKLIHTSAYDNYAPDPDGSVSYENYLKENLNDKGGTITGGEEMLQIAKNYVAHNLTIDEIEEKKRLCSNVLKNFIGENNTLDFGVEGKITWKANIKGIRMFKVSLKV